MNIHEDVTFISKVTELNHIIPNGHRTDAKPWSFTLQGRINFPTPCWIMILAEQYNPWEYIIRCFALNVWSEKGEVFFACCRRYALIPWLVNCIPPSTAPYTADNTNTTHVVSNVGIQYRRNTYWAISNTKTNKYGQFLPIRDDTNPTNDAITPLLTADTKTYAFTCFFRNKWKSDFFFVFWLLLFYLSRHSGSN